jgi:hypothetical protein
VKQIHEVFNTDALEYGGSNQIDKDIEVESDCFVMTVAPLATIIFEVEFA